MLKALDRQLRRLGLRRDRVPSPEEWTAFLEHVERRYAAAEQDRYLLERSLMVSSKEMKEVYDDLRRSENKFKTLVERMPDAVFVQSGLNLKYANPAMLRLLGVDSADELRALGPLTNIVHPDDRATLRDVIRRRDAGEPVCVPRIRWLKKGASVLFIDSTAASIVYDGQPATLVIARDVTEELEREAERARALEALQLSEERYRSLFEASPLAIYLFDPQTLQFLDANGAALQMYGYTREEFLALRLTDVKPAADPDLAEMTENVVTLAKNEAWRGEKRHRRKDGALMAVEINSHPVLLDRRRAMLCIASDVTARRVLEEKLRQSQKLEGIGQLAGGVAHDFNNLLSVILSNTEIALEALPEGADAKRDLEEVVRAAERATSLTGQLLAFSRKQIMERKVIDLAQSVAAMERMLARLVTEDVALIVRVQPGLSKVFADVGQMEQVILNLVVNARDANARTIRIDLANHRIDSTEISADVAAGDYVRFTVRDDGVGMDEATRQRVFEPFFTTKEPGKGTGLGLSTVLGIVQQTGGHVRVQSQKGKGSSFEILLPAISTGEAASAHTCDGRTSKSGGDETILLVEDDASVRTVCRDVLQSHGYTVLEAPNAGEALLFCERYSEPIHLLLTDVVMPHMNGRELAHRAKIFRPGMKVLFMSGYTDDVVLLNGISQAGVAYLQKPVRPVTLLHKVREVLDARIKRSSRPGVATERGSNA